LGIPISLAVLYMIVAERLGIPAYGVGLPGHFVVGIMDETQGMLWLDPFNEGVWLSVGDCQRLVQNTAGVEPRDFQMSWLQPTAVEEILSRMLNNLRLIYLQRQQWQPARQCVRFLHRLQPNASELWRDEGLIELQMGNFAKAVSLFEQYLQETPEAEDRVLIQQQLAPTVQKWALLN
jgi:regulator of sirC expression with transglutaminase-like and TPR domain